MSFCKERPFESYWMWERGDFFQKIQYKNFPEKAPVHAIESFCILTEHLNDGRVTN